jgi:hypothetical protein
MKLLIGILVGLCLIVFVFKLLLPALGIDIHLHHWMV